MTDSRETAAVADVPPWPARPAILGGLGLATGLVIHLIVGGDVSRQLSAFEVASLMFVTVSAMLVAFTLEQRLWRASIGFSLAWGLVAALMMYWNGGTNGWGATEGWRMTSLFLSLAIAAPLFQAARDQGALRFPYASVHDQAWTNIVVWCGAWLFVGIVFGLAWLLAALFQLIGLRFLADLLGQGWFYRVLMGLAFGGAVGLLRERDQIVRQIQRVVTTVLAVLAPVFAVGLWLFLIALAFAGVDTLWNATRSTTPILLGCVIGGLMLANAVIGTAESEAKAAPLRWAAMALGLAILPLAILAFIATGMRVGQYGYTPQRLWALTFVVIATAYGIAYLGALIRGRLGWTRFVRPANLVLAFGVCLVALFLATPIMSFNAMSTRDQIGRLRSGKVMPERFDYTALAFDFGEPGRRALRRLQASDSAEIRSRAKAAANATSRWSAANLDLDVRAQADILQRVRILPRPVALPDDLKQILAQRWRCGDARCTLFFLSDSQALLFTDRCFDPLSSCADPTRLARGPSGWAEVDASTPPVTDAATRRAVADAYRAGRIEIRTVPRRQVFVGGKPVGDPFE